MISREEAIDIAEFQKEVFEEESNVVKMVNRAISDMQKIEKIEQLIETIKCEEDLYQLEKECGSYEMLLDIFRIIKGEE